MKHTLIALLLAAFVGVGLIPTATTVAQKAPETSGKKKAEPKKKAPAKKKAKSSKKNTTTKKKTAAKKPTSICQGLTKSGCGGKSKSCSWVDATTRKDGVKVKAYCRKKAKPGTAKSKAPAKKKSTAKKKTTSKKASKNTAKKN